MADKMMRVAGRGADGSAKPLKTDNSGNLFSRLLGTEPLDTAHLTAVSATTTGAVANVAGYGSIAFHVGGTFKGRVFFEGSIIPGLWEALPVISSIGTYSTFVENRGIYKADIAGYREVRARLEWTSGTSATVRSVATVIGSAKDVAINLTRQNSRLFTQTDSYQVTRNRAYYGNFTRASTSVSDIKPIDYRNHSKKTVFVTNNFDVDIKIANFFKYANVDDPGASWLEKVETDIAIPKSGGVGRLSYLDYPELVDPFVGLIIELEAINALPTTGNVKIDWMGGN